MRLAASSRQFVLTHVETTNYRGPKASLSTRPPTCCRCAPLIPNRVSSALPRRRLVEALLTTLMFQCPKTKRLVSTSIDIDLADIDKLPDRVTFSQCPHCRTVHGWTPKDTFVSEGLQVRRPKP